MDERKCFSYGLRRHNGKSAYLVVVATKDPDVESWLAREADAFDDLLR
jgi:hypothetical protein